MRLSFLPVKNGYLFRVLSPSGGVISINLSSLALKMEEASWRRISLIFLALPVLEDLFPLDLEKSAVTGGEKSFRKLDRKFRRAGNYGIRGMEMFTDLAGFHNVCIASTDSVASSDSDHEFDRVVDTLKKTPNASVVVCFCEGITVQKLLKAFSRKGVAGNDGWGNRLDVVRNQEETAAGGISIKLYSPPIPDFDTYYASLKPNSTMALRNPWFNEFWQQKFACYLTGEEREKKFTDPCTGIYILLFMRIAETSVEPFILCITYYLKHVYLCVTDEVVILAMA
ncbi:hypothetical protein BaRGS_00005642 [Batillaria attramentaria]|uniref:Receptor ligand binding region domain-containing protein n=1 Tax=Batillaria attramentaria TaxID=370345 RepID=A0ABD0LV48_9CAEN